MLLFDSGQRGGGAWPIHIKDYASLGLFPRLQTLQVRNWLDGAN